MKRKRFLLGLLYSLILFPVLLNAAEPVQLISETSRLISFTVDVPEPVFVPVGDVEGVACSVEGFRLYHERQMPGVVLRGVMAAIPQGVRVEMDISVNFSQEFENIDLAPVPTYVLDSLENDADTRIQYSKDQQVYRSDKYFPAQPAAIDYTGNLRGMHFAQILITPVQYNPVQRIVRVARSMTVTLSFDGLDEAAGVSQMVFENSTVPVGRAFDAIRNAAIINPDSDLIDMRLGPKNSMAQPALSGELQSSPFAIKIITSEPGIYRVQYEDISMLGVELSGLTNSNIKVENLGQEIAVYRSGTDQFESGDYILFYVEDFQSESSNKNVYWLYQGSDNGLRMQTVNSDPDSGFAPEDSFRTSMLFEQDLIWKRNLNDYIVGEDQWFWKLFNIFGSTTQAIPFTLNDFATDADTAEIELYLRGSSVFNHRTQVFLNGTLIGDFEWQGAVIERRTLTGISPSLFNEGSNTLTVEAVAATGNDPGSTPDSYYVNWADLTYAQRYVATDNRLCYGSDTSGDASIDVSGFTDSDIRVFDVTHPAAPLILTGTSIETSSGFFSVRYEYSLDSTSAFCAVTPDSSLIPDDFVVDAPSNLMSPRSEIDYIIITNALFASTVEQLKTIREQSGLNVEIVDVQDIYDEFSYGIKDVAAIKDFLRYAYLNWHASDHPTYVVLVGDATYDYRDNLGLAASGKADLVPTYLGYRGAFGTSVGATASDNWYVCVDGDDPLPDMIIGRLCVKTNQDLQNIIDKIETYENALPDEWQSRVIYAADEDDQTIFEELAESLIEILPAAYTDLQINLSQYGADITTATSDLIAAISNGALITNYLGHGSVDKWSNSSWFETPNQNLGTTRDDVSLLTNTDQYTFLIILNCFSGAFSEVKDEYCMAEEFVRQQSKGAVFCVAPSASGFTSEHEVLGKKIYDYLFNGNITIGGALLTASKIAAYQQTNSRDLLETFIFFGDPALELKVTNPVSECETDSDCEEGFECTDGVCSDNTYVECEVDADCSDGVCSDNTCVECAVDQDCDSGTCISNVCIVEGSVQIDKFTVKAGKNGKGDRIKFKGLLDATEADFNAAIGGNVIVTIESDDVPDFNATTYTFPIEEDTLKMGQYRSLQFKFTDRSYALTFFKVNINTGKFTFFVYNVNLAGLRCPITVTIQIGDYVAEKVLDEDIVNGPKIPCPPEFMVRVFMKHLRSFKYRQGQQWPYLY